MLAILDRYIFREVAQTWIAVTGVLLFILVSNQFARVLGGAAAGKFPKDAVFPLLGLTSIQYLTILIPVGLFLAVMLALGRLYKDSEMAAIMAGGLGPRRIYRPLLWFAFFVAALLAWLALDLGPRAAMTTHIMKRTAQRDAQFDALEAGRFRSTSGGEMVFYAEAITRDGVMRNVFIQRRSGIEVQVAVAAKGELQRDDVVNRRTLILYDGYRYEGTPGTVNFRVTRFAEHGIPIYVSEPDFETSRREIVSTSELMNSNDTEDIAELQWRISVPLMAIVLTLLAAPLSKTSPRQGRYAKLALGILIYVVYANVLGVARVWIENGTLPPWLGLWWVHGLVVLMAFVLLFRQNGVLWLFDRSRGRPHRRAEPSG